MSNTRELESKLSEFTTPEELTNISNGYKKISDFISKILGDTENALNFDGTTKKTIKWINFGSGKLIRSEGNGKIDSLAKFATYSDVLKPH